MKHTRWLTGLLVTAALAAGTLAAAYFITPGVRRPSLAEGDILACMEADGSLVLSWPDAGAGSVYLVELHAGGQSLRQHTEKSSLALTGVSAPFQVRVQAAASGKNLLGMDRELTSLTSLNAEVAAAALETPVLIGEPERGAMTFSWEGGKSPVYAVCALRDGVYLPVASSSGTGTYLRFDGKEGPELPAHGQPLELALRAGAPGAGYVLYGPPSAPVTVERGDLLGDALSLAVQETEPRVYALEWNEARGVEYELREWQDGAWVTLDRPEPAETFRCELGRLDSGSYHRYQVLTRDRGGERQVEEEVSFYATVTPLYCTVWPIIDLDFCESAGGVQSLGRIPAGTTLCVLEEDGRWFRVRYKDRYGYVDSRCCMVNLSEYTGDYCAYDITNSYESLFKVHDSPMATITGQVIPGFENMLTEEDGFLVPYLYPCAQKLLSAAQAALEDGYRLKIYEAFRPNEATRYLYDTAAAKLADPALVLDEEENAVDPVTGWRVDLTSGFLIDPETEELIDPALLLEPEEEEAPPEDGTEEELPQTPEDGTEEEPPQMPEDESGLLEAGGETPEEAGLTQEDSETGENPETGEPPAEDGEEPPEEPEEIPDNPTYGAIMTDNGRFRLGSFLAAVTSAHNRGIALDLTLETADVQAELEMQSAIHDLSWYSAVYLNNDNAELLAGYMTGTGMAGLSSEWWHFQDNETREAIGLTSYLYKGVDAGGWTRDDRGWRYRDPSGRYYRGTTITVDGKRYTMDRDGYTSQAPAE